MKLLSKLKVLTHNTVVHMHELYYLIFSVRTIQMPPENHLVACINGTLQLRPPFTVDFGGILFSVATVGERKIIK